MTNSRFNSTALLIGLIITATSIGVFFWTGPWPANPQGQPAHNPVGSLLETQRNNKLLPRRQDDTAIEESPFQFELMTPGSGIDFEYYGSPTQEAYMTEQNGGGVALADFDNDQQLDLFLVNGSNFDHPASESNESNRLYRAVDNFQYLDVTQSSGLIAHGFGMGCVAGDYDNDGFTDLFVACYGRDRLWHNNGDGTFMEVTDSAGVGSELWGTSAAMADLDGDGLLDLYVVNYVEWSSEEPPCHPLGHPEFNSVCSPMERSGQPDVLYKNLGDGRFAEVGSKAGVARAKDGKGLALTIADFNEDGRLDIYVANDTSPNFLYHNMGDMQFEEVGTLQGVAISRDGLVGSGMGVACADYDHNGHLDLFVTNFRNQVNDLFANLGQVGFIGVNGRTGMDLVSRSPLGFGIVLADFNLDSWPDLFVANGHIWDLTSTGQGSEYQMHPQVLWNRQGQQFLDVSRASGDYFNRRWLGRSVAVGDLDNDGDPDIVVSHLMAPPAVLRNDCKRTGSSVRIELIGIKSSRQPLGARITAVTGKEKLVVQVPAGGSFQACHDPRVLIAVASPITEIQVQWPTGDIEIWKNVTANDRGDIRLIEGTGE